MGDWVMLFQFLTGTLPKQYFHEPKHQTKDA